MRAVDQLSGGGSYPHEDCQEACTASVLYDAGKADTVPAIEAFDFGDGDNPSDGTGGKVIVDRLARAGIAAHLDRRPIAAVLAEARLRGLNRVFVAIWSDHAGNPSPGSGLGHWILWGGGVDYMQPVGGHVVQYSDDQVRAASQGAPGAGYSVVVDAPVGAAQEDDMGWNLDQKRLAVIEVRRHYQAWPESLEAIDFLAVQIKDDGSNYLAIRDLIRQKMEADGWVDFFDQVAQIRATIQALGQSHGADDPSVQAELQKLETQMAAIAKAAGGG